MDRMIAVEELHAATAIYTSVHVVDALLDRLEWPESGGRLLDPSAGDGSFLLQALQRLDVNKPGEVDRIQGWEIHSGAAQEARQRVADHLKQHGWGASEAAAASVRMIVNSDCLTNGPEPGEFRLIAGNPPYIRFQHLPEYFKGVYMDSLPKYARGDLLHGFLDWCVKFLPANGAIGLVCSDRFLFNANATELRRVMGGRVGISYLARLDASTSFYRPKQRVRGAPPRIHPVEVVLRPAGKDCPAMTGAAISPDGMGCEEPGGRTLADIAKVSIAPWLGPLGIFVVSAEEALALRRGHAELIPAVDTDDIDPETDQLYVDPETGKLRAPNRFAIKTLRENKPVAVVDRHLQARRAKMPNRGRNRAYWLPPETINLSLDRPSLLIPRIARRLRVIDLPAGVLPINHNLSVASTDTMPLAAAMPLAELRELLLSETSQEWIKRNAPRLENGFYSITTRLLRRLPV